MANEFDPLLPALYKAVDIVGREMVGFIPSVTLDATAEGAAVGQSIDVPVTPAATSEPLVPGPHPPVDNGQSIIPRQFAITNMEGAKFTWTGEEQKGVNTGPGYSGIQLDQITQAIRTLTNKIEASCAATYVSASRAWGTAGTTPFQADLSDPANALKILKDNGAGGDFNMVIDTTAGAKLRSLSQFTKANEAGTTDLRERGILLDIHGFKIRESAGVRKVAAGTGTGFLLNGAHAAGETTINVDTGAGTILRGDTVAIGDYEYVVETAKVGGSFTINAPGLMESVPDNTAITVGAAYTPNMAFARSAIVLATRVPAMPTGGDSADAVEYVTDPMSGLTFRFARYPQFLQAQYQVQIAWGAACIKPEFVALLKG